MTLSSNMKVYEFEEVVSTNTLALEKAKEGIECPSWFTAKSQTGGRGRGGKKWVSQEGNLFATFLCHQTGKLPKATEIGFLSAVAAFDAICEVAPQSANWLALKWPNDVLLGGKKLAGILLETEKAPGKESWYLVAGFGVNLASHPEDTDWPATHLSREDARIRRSDCLKALMKHMAYWFSLWQSKGFTPVRETWITRGPELGSSMAVKHHGKKISGSYGGLDNDGGLLMIRDTGEMTKIIAGQITPED